MYQYQVLSSLEKIVVLYSTNTKKIFLAAPTAAAKSHTQCSAMWQRNATVLVLVAAFTCIHGAKLGKVPGLEHASPEVVHVLLLFCIRCLPPAKAVIVLLGIDWQPI